MTDNEPPAAPVRAAVAAADLPTAMVPATADAPPPPRSAPPTGGPWRLTTLIAAVAVVLAAALVGYVALRSDNVAGRLVTDSEEVARRAAVTAVTAVASYDYQDLDATVRAMNTLATPELAEELTTALESLRSAVAEQRTVVTAEVTFTGLADFRSDCDTGGRATAQCATVLLAVGITTTRDGVVDPHRVRQRVRAVMTMVDHTWLLSDLAHL